MAYGYWHHENDFLRFFKRTIAQFQQVTSNKSACAVEEKFKIDKKTIVMKKQQGIASDDLWIAYWIAAKKGTSADSILKVKQSSDVWKDVFTTLHVDSQPFGTRFSKALNTRASSATLAEIAVDELFLRNHILKDADLAALRQVGASNQGVIIATVISAKTQQPVRQVYLEVKNGSKSWGAHLQRAHIDTNNMQQDVSVLLEHK